MGRVPFPELPGLPPGARGPVERNFGEVERYLPREITFSWFGTPPTEASGPGRAQGGGTLGLVEVLLGTAGSTSTVVTIYKNGVAMSPTITLVSGAASASAVLGVAVKRTDVITAACTTVGTGAKSPTVYISY